jgi:hypothetical protein
MNNGVPSGVDPAANKVTHSVTEYVSDHAADAASDAIVSPGITPQIVAVIEAAAAAFLGLRIRILSVRILSESPQDSSPWAEKGRDIIQASHNLVQRGH